MLAVLPPAPDFVNGLLVLLSFRAAHAFGGRTLVVWIAVLLVLVAAPVVYTQGLVWGLALSLAAMAGCVVVPAYAIANRQIEAARVESEALLGDLQEAHRKLQAYSLEAAELATVEERNRLVRELHDSVSQTLFSANLTASAARLLLARDPAQARPQLERLQALSQSALARGRHASIHRRLPGILHGLALLLRGLPDASLVRAQKGRGHISSIVSSAWASPWLPTRSCCTR